nr:line-1 retrotransposable element orf2 protein [Quercus suber]
MMSSSSLSMWWSNFCSSTLRTKPQASLSENSVHVVGDRLVQQLGLLDLVLIGLILDSPDPSAETLVQRVDRGRFRFEFGGSSVGHRLLATQAQPNKDGVNILSLARMQTENQKRIKGIKLGKDGTPLTHLFFANDALLFFKHDAQSLPNLQHILNWYCSLSGQSINLSKSDLYYSPNMAEEVKLDLAQSLKVNLVQSPNRYLGINFVLKGKRVADFQFLVDKMHSKLQGWKAKLLSQAARTTLISSTLQSMSLYTFSCFKFSKEGTKFLRSLGNSSLKWLKQEPRSFTELVLPMKPEIYKGRVIL